MSSEILPSLVGLGFSVTRTPQWDTVVQQSISGMETRFARQSYPRWSWNLSYTVLRSSIAYTEFQQLAGFFNKRQGMLDSFLYQDPDDHTVTGQIISTANGTQTNFQLIRNLGGFNEPIFAPNVVTAVYLNGVAQIGGYSITEWNDGNTAGPGMIIFTTAPASGVLITADFSYYFPVRMTADSVPFELFISQHYSAKKFGFISIKN